MSQPSPFFRIALAAIFAFALPGSTSMAAPPAGVLVITGTRIEGGAPNRLVKLLDLRTGFNRLTYGMGDGETQQGFDHQDWVAVNGITNAIDLPALVADARARAWVERAAWLQTGASGTSRRVNPPGASALTLFFGSGRRVDHLVIDSDDGPLTITFSDWRRVGPYLYPFRIDTLGETGDKTATVAEKVEFRGSLGARALDRPPSVSHAELGGAAATIPITLTGSRRTHILVDASINGAPSKLIFDTGAANYVTTDSAPKFSLHPMGGLNLGGVGESSTTGGFATIDRIALGQAALRHETIVIGPSPFPKAAGKPAEVDGFTGFEFLAEFITTIDYPGSTLTFAPRGTNHHPGGVRVPFTSDGHSIYVEAMIEGRKGTFRLDTGDGGTLTIFPSFARKAGLSGNKPVATGSGGIGGTVSEQPGTLGGFALGGLAFAKLPVSFSLNKSGAFASRSLAGNLGAQLLQCYRLTFDYAGRTIWFDPLPSLPTCGGGATVTRR